MLLKLLGKLLSLTGFCGVSAGQQKPMNILAVSGPSQVFCFLWIPVLICVEQQMLRISILFSLSSCRGAGAFPKEGGVATRSTAVLDC